MVNFMRQLDRAKGMVRYPVKHDFGCVCEDAFKLVD